MSSAYAATVKMLPHSMSATIVRLTQTGAGSRKDRTITRTAQIGRITARFRRTVRPRPGGRGKKKRRDDQEAGADRRDSREMPEPGPPPPARIGQLMPHPVHV